MRFQKVVVGILMLQFLVFLLFVLIKPIKETVEYRKENPIQFNYLVSDGNVILGSKSISAPEFVKVVEMTMDKIISNPAVETQVEKAAGVQFKNLEYNTEERYVTEKKILFDNSEKQAIILEIYNNEKELVDMAIRVYQRRKNDPVFMRKVRVFLEQNR
jgi:hypothetical protein